MKFWEILDYLVYLRTFLLIMITNILYSDQNTGNGCSLCMPNYNERSLQFLHGKSILSSELACSEPGAYIGLCPEDAHKIEKRVAKTGSCIPIHAITLITTKKILDEILLARIYS